ncbi:hypothetical protein SteCoe_21363 [Stentor coeruleus]|uniref:Uncharacterized protein n=1 Tax=Stentor coeruleus TaxID=5963 RepID=A0A1R2BPM9_9CILI|nr:hypothetical protein SteCoe_21363 [Stentor coeruleus]
MVSHYKVLESQGKLSCDLIKSIEVLDDKSFTREACELLDKELTDDDENVRFCAREVCKKRIMVCGLPLYWNDYIEILGCLEMTEKNDFKKIWIKVYSIFQYDIDKVKTLYKQARLHKNHKICIFIVKDYMKNSHFHENFTTQDFISNLMDPIFFQSPKSSYPKSPLPELIKSFFSSSLQKSSNKTKSFQNLIKNYLSSDFPQNSIFWFMSIFIDNFTQDILDKDLLDLILEIQTKWNPKLKTHEKSQLIIFSQLCSDNAPDNFLIEKILLASLTCSHNKILYSQFRNSTFLYKQSTDIIQNSIPLIIQGKTILLSPKAFGLLVSLCPDPQLVKILSPFIQSLQSIYRSTYLKTELSISWLMFFKSICKYLNVYNKELLLMYIPGLLDEIFSYGISITDFGLAVIIGKTLKNGLINIGFSHVSWAITKLTFLLQRLQMSQDLIFNYYVFMSYILAYGEKYDLIQFKSIARSLLVGIGDFGLYVTRENCVKNGCEGFKKLADKAYWRICKVLGMLEPEIVINRVGEGVLRCCEESIVWVFESAANSISGGSEKEIEDVCEKAWNAYSGYTQDPLLRLTLSFSRLAFNQHTMKYSFSSLLLYKIFETRNKHFGLIRAILISCIPHWLLNPSLILNFSDAIFLLTTYSDPSYILTNFLPYNFPFIQSGIQENSISIYQNTHSSTRISSLLLIETQYKNQPFSEKILQNCLKILNSSEISSFTQTFMGQLLCSLTPYLLNSSLSQLTLYTKNLCQILLTPTHSKTKPYIQRSLINIIIKYPDMFTFLPISYNSISSYTITQIIITLGHIMIFVNSSIVREKIFIGLLPYVFRPEQWIRKLVYFFFIILVNQYSEFMGRSDLFVMAACNSEWGDMEKCAEKISGIMNGYMECGVKAIMYERIRENGEKGRYWKVDSYGIIEDVSICDEIYGYWEMSGCHEICQCDMENRLI